MNEHFHVEVPNCIHSPYAGWCNIKKNKLTNTQNKYVHIAKHLNLMTMKNQNTG